MEFMLLFNCKVQAHLSLCIVSIVPFLILVHQPSSHHILGAPGAAVCFVGSSTFSFLLGPVQYHMAWTRYVNTRCHHCHPEAVFHLQSNTDDRIGRETTSLQPKNANPGSTGPENKGSDKDEDEMVALSRQSTAGMLSIWR